MSGCFRAECDDDRGGERRLPSFADDSQALSMAQPSLLCPAELHQWSQIRSDSLYREESVTNQHGWEAEPETRRSPHCKRHPLSTTIREYTGARSCHPSGDGYRSLRLVMQMSRERLVCHRSYASKPTFNHFVQRSGPQIKFHNIHDAASATRLQRGTDMLGISIVYLKSSRPGSRGADEWREATHGGGRG